MCTLSFSLFWFIWKFFLWVCNCLPTTVSRQIEALYKQKKSYWFVSALIYCFMTNLNRWTWTGASVMHLLHISKRYYAIWTMGTDTELTFWAWCSYCIKVQIREILIRSRKYPFRKVELFKCLWEVFFTGLIICYCYTYQEFYRALDVSLELIQEIYFYLYSAFFVDYGTSSYL